MIFHARSLENGLSHADLFADRTSVREYAARPVQPELISEAIGICSKSPSVCNRQPYRVRLITDTKQIESILAVQGGMTGYSTPPALLAVTTDIRDFVGMNERNQVYVDGGIHSMALMMALEFVGLAACPLNAMFSRSKEKQMRSLLGTQHEAFIMFIAVGHFASSSQAPKSFRYDEDKLVVED